MLGLLVGQRRWKKEQIKQEKKKYDDGLQETYLELWDVVEDAHMKMRQSLVGEANPARASAFVADVNNFMIRKGLYIERRDRFLVLEYLFWTNEYLRILASSPSGRAAILTSLAHDDELPANIMMLKEVENKAQALRNELRDRIRSVIGAPPSSGWSSEIRPSDDLLGKLAVLTEEVSKRVKEAQSTRPELTLDNWIEEERRREIGAPRTPDRSAGDWLV